MAKPIYIPQEISKGSAHVTSELNHKFDRTTYMMENMESNYAYRSYLDQKKIKNKDFKILNEFKNRYSKYRKDWKEQPINAFKKISFDKFNDEFFKEINFS